MINKFLKKQTPFIAMATVALLVVTSISVTTVEARPGSHGGHFPIGHAHSILFGSLIYFFLEGIFYREVPTGYIVTPAPIGARIPVLPPAAALVTIGGKPYYTYSGIYYQRMKEGYVVVQQPDVSVIKNRNENQRITVIVPTLNVRSGPGQENPVTEEVEEGEVLVVEKMQNTWCLVRLKNGHLGWVMSRYTTPLQLKSQG